MCDCIEDRVDDILWNEKSCDQLLPLLLEERRIVLERVKNLNRAIAEVGKMVEEEEARLNSPAKRERRRIAFLHRR